MKRRRSPVIGRKQEPLSYIMYDVSPDRDYNFDGGDVSDLIAQVRSFYEMERRTLRKRISDLSAMLPNIDIAERQAYMGILSNRNNGSGTSDNWLVLMNEIEPTRFIKVLTGVVRAGHNLTISRTKKGNALVVALYDGESNDKLYPETSQELLEIIETLEDAYAPAPPPPRTDKARK